MPGISKALGPTRKSHSERSHQITISSPQITSKPPQSIDVSDDDVVERKGHKKPISKLFRGDRLQKYSNDSDSGSSVGTMPNDSTNSFPDDAGAEYGSYNAEDAFKESHDSTGGVVTLEMAKATKT